MKNNNPTGTEYTYEQAATIFAGMLSEDILTFYNHLCTVPELSQELISKLQDWLLIPGGDQLFNPIDAPKIDKVIHFILETEVQYQDVSDMYSRIKNIKRNRRMYLYRKIREEAGLIGQFSKKGTHMLESEWQALNNPFIREKLYESKEVFLQARLTEISEWYNSPTGYIFQFPYFSTLSFKKQIESFLIDLKCEILSLICEHFYKNIFGFVTKIPDILLESDFNLPVVSWVSSTMNLNYETRSDRVIVYETIAQSEIADTRIVIAEVKMDCSTETKANASILKVQSDYENSALTKTFDTKDFAILTAVFNNIDLKSANGDIPVRMSAKSLLTDIQSNIASPKKRNFVDVLSRLSEIASMCITSNLFDNKGRWISSDRVPFFDLKMRIEDRNDDEQSAIIYQIIDCNSDFEKDMFNLLNQDDFNKMSIELYPALWIKNQWRENIHNVVYSQVYKQIPSQKGKFLFQLIHRERMRVYPESSVDITMKFFRDNLRSNQGLTRFRKEILNELETFKQNAIKERIEKCGEKRHDVMCSSCIWFDKHTLFLYNITCVCQKRGGSYER